MNKINNTLLPIIVKNLSYSKGNKILLNNISCDINSLGISVILGPNGSGKSLFLRCLHGLAEFDKGKLIYKGIALNKKIRLEQSMVFQTPIMLRRSVLNNLVFVIKQRNEYDENKIQIALKRVKLFELKEQPAFFLSGGEKQRLALARAIITEPKILFLDEATSNLDPYSINIIEKLIKEISKNGTKVISITQDINHARRIADDILFFNKGKLCEYTDAKIFFQKPFSKEAKIFLKGNLLV